jgi:hypothetical protein
MGGQLPIIRIFFPVKTLANGITTNQLPDDRKWMSGRVID